MTDAEATAMADAIKNLEPKLRSQGKAPDWSKFHWQFHSGQFSEANTLDAAIDASAGDKLEFRAENIQE